MGHNDEEGMLLHMGLVVKNYTTERDVVDLRR